MILFRKTITNNLYIFDNFFQSIQGAEENIKFNRIRVNGEFGRKSPRSSVFEYLWLLSFNEDNQLW